MERPKIKMQADLNTDELQPNCPCDPGIQRLENKMNEVLAEIRALRAEQNQTGNQLNILVDAFKGQVKKTKGFAEQQGNFDIITKQFPIATVDELIDMDHKIIDSNRDLYVKGISTLLQPEGVQKNLKNVLSEAVTLQYNVQGVKGKVSLRAHVNFYAVLLEAISVDCGHGSNEAERQLRKGLHVQKKRYFKNIFMLKNRKKKEN